MASAQTKIQTQEKQNLNFRQFLRSIVGPQLFEDMEEYFLPQIEGDIKVSSKHSSYINHRLLYEEGCSLEDIEQECLSNAKNIAEQIFFIHNAPFSTKEGKLFRDGNQNLWFFRSSDDILYGISSYFEKVKIRNGFYYSIAPIDELKITKDSRIFLAD